MKRGGSHRKKEKRGETHTEIASNASSTSEKASFEYIPTNRCSRCGKEWASTIGVSNWEPESHALA
jgi:hypothetical protein